MDSRLSLPVNLYQHQVVSLSKHLTSHYCNWHLKKDSTALALLFKQSTRQTTLWRLYLTTRRCPVWPLKTLTRCGSWQTQRSLLMKIRRHCFWGTLWSAGSKTRLCPRQLRCTHDLKRTSGRITFGSKSSRRKSCQRRSILPLSSAPSLLTMSWLCCGKK